MSILEFHFWKWLSERLPRKLLYFALIRVALIEAGPKRQINPYLTMDQALRCLGVE